MRAKNSYPSSRSQVYNTTKDVPNLYSGMTAIERITILEENGKALKDNMTYLYKAIEELQAKCSKIDEYGGACNKCCWRETRSPYSQCMMLEFVGTLLPQDIFQHTLHFARSNIHNFLPCLLNFTGEFAS